MASEDRVPAPSELVALATRTGQALHRARLVVATAESCTGGLVGHLITEVPGSSNWFAGAAVTYSYAAKEQVLGVDPQDLARYGAVSPQVARQMAHGALALFPEAQVAVAITGIAGPTGGTPDKPVGLVYLHLAARDGTQRGECRIWSADRRGNKLLSAQLALEMLYEHAQRRGGADPCM